jgi:hypothetical protein
MSATTDANKSEPELCAALTTQIKTSVILTFYIPQKPFANLYSLFIKKKIEKKLRQSIIHLQQLLSES